MCFTAKRGREDLTNGSTSLSTDSSQECEPTSDLTLWCRLKHCDDPVCGCITFTLINASPCTHHCIHDLHLMLEVMCDVLYRLCFMTLGGSCFLITHLRFVRSHTRVTGHSKLHIPPTSQRERETIFKTRWQQYIQREPNVNYCTSQTSKSISTYFVFVVQSVVLLPLDRRRKIVSKTLYLHALKSTFLLALYNKTVGC